MIELHRRMNGTVEAMAGALLTSWFVAFDPFRAVAEGLDPGLLVGIADLFPVRLVDSDLGEIREGSTWVASPMWWGSFVGVHLAPPFPRCATLCGPR